MRFHSHVTLLAIIVSAAIILRPKRKLTPDGTGVNKVTLYFGGTPGPPLGTIIIHGRGCLHPSLSIATHQFSHGTNAQLHHFYRNKVLSIGLG